MKLKMLIAAVLSATLLSAGAASACNAPPNAAPPAVVLKTACPATPTKLVHLRHLPAQIDLKVGDTVAFAADKVSGGSEPSVAIPASSAMKVLNPAIYYKGTLYSRGDEEGLWNVFEAAQPGTYTATVTHSAAAGAAAKTETVTIVVTK